MTPEFLAFKALVAVLQADDALSSLVRTWQVDRGTPAEQWLSTEGQAVEVDLLPDLESIAAAEDVAYLESLIVRVLAKLPEPGSEARFAFWAALRHALEFSGPAPSAYLPDDTNVPDATTAYLYLRAAGVNDVQIVQPLRIVSAPALKTSQACEARVRLQLFVNR